jgi:hypothetical protein
MVTVGGQDIGYLVETASGSGVFGAQTRLADGQDPLVQVRASSRLP